MHTSVIPLSLSIFILLSQWTLALPQVPNLRPSLSTTPPPTAPSEVALKLNADFHLKFSITDPVSQDRHGLLKSLGAWREAVTGARNVREYDPLDEATNGACLETDSGVPCVNVQVWPQTNEERAVQPLDINIMYDTTVALGKAFYDNAYFATFSFVKVSSGQSFGRGCISGAAEMCPREDGGENVNVYTGVPQGNGGLGMASSP